MRLGYVSINEYNNNLKINVLNKIIDIKKTPQHIHAEEFLIEI